MSRPQPPVDTGTIDPESRAWLDSLRSQGAEHEQAVARLHALLLRAARFEAARRWPMLPELDRSELDDLAVQSANDALLAVLSKLDRFAGKSRFTTWAYKFALLETAVKLRRRPWQEREIPVEPDQWLALTAASQLVDEQVQERELLAAVRRAIATELTPHQREVLVAVAVGGVPIDVLAQRLGTTRGALYKTIHDARGKLRRRLRCEGHDPDRSAQGGSW
jgi:RNA polymerase sigma-70 factor (ECF subfamily)